MELHTGDVIKVGHGRYQLMKVLGHGDQSVVFDARSQAGEVVAVKISPEPTWESQRHWRVVHQAPSSHLVRVLDTDKAADGDFLTVMERVDGIDLRQLSELLAQEKRCVAPRLAVEIVYQAVRGLEDVLVRTGQPHGDVKPANLMVDRRGVVKLLDYGGGQWRALSATGKMPVDVAHLAPEQANLEDSWGDDPRSDIFSLGAILYELVMGEPLYDFSSRHTAYQRLMTVARADLTRQLSRVAAVHPALIDVLHISLARDPEARFRSYQEMAGRLASLAAELPPVLPLELFAESLYQTVHTGHWSAALDGALPELGLEPSAQDGQGRPGPALVWDSDLAARSAAARSDLDDFEDFHLKRRPGMAMLAGMLLTLAVIIGLMVAFWQPREVNQAIRDGAEFFSNRPQPAIIPVQNPPPAP